MSKEKIPTQSDRLSLAPGDRVGQSDLAAACRHKLPHSPCRRELPVLATIQKQGTRDKIAIFAVNWRESADQFRQIRRAFKDIDLSLVSDESGRFGRQYGVNGIPHMVVIGRDGRIAAVHVGYGESEIPVLVDEINSLWNKPAGPECAEGCSGQ